MNNVSPENESSLEQRLKSDASMFDSKVSDVSKQRLFGQIENELANNRNDLSQSLPGDGKQTPSFNATRFFALAASVLVVVSLGVVIYKESYTGSYHETRLTPDVASTPDETKSNSLVMEQRVANYRENITGLESKLVASKQLNNELNLIKSDIDKLAKRIASL